MPHWLEMNTVAESTMRTWGCFDPVIVIIEHDRRLWFSVY